MKIVILTYESHQANLMTHRLLAEFPGQVTGIMRSEVIVAGKNTWQSMWFLSKRTGLGFVARKGAEIILSRAAAFLNKAQIPPLAHLGGEFAVPVVGAKNVNAPESLAILAGWRPDLIISVYLNQLIKSEIIAMAPRGVINVHPALLPKNRGLFPYFWALANGDDKSGVTVHWVDKKFDTGQILVQRALPIAPDETVISLARRSAELGANLLVDAVKLIEAGNPPKIPQNPEQASYFSWPTPADVRRFERRGCKYGSIREMWRDLVN